MKLLNIKPVLGPILPALLLITLLITTDPNKLPVFLLPLPFVLLLISLLLGIQRILEGAGLSKPRARLTGIGVASGLVALLVLRSLNQLTLRDAVLMLVFVLLFVGYLNRLQERS